MTIFEDFNTPENSTITGEIPNDIAAWYHTFKNPPTDGTNAEPNKKPVAKINPILSDLMLYAFQLKSYSEFIVSMANSIESDIQRDIRMDNTIPIVPVVSEGQQPPVTNLDAAMPKPLALAVKNREGIVTAAANINELAKAVDSILSRVKGIE